MNGSQVFFATYDLGYLLGYQGQGEWFASVLSIDGKPQTLEVRRIGYSRGIASLFGVVVDPKTLEPIVSEEGHLVSVSHSNVSQTLPLFKKPN